MKTKVVDITMQVTCLEDEAETVRQSLNSWFCENETALAQHPRTGGIHTGKPRPIQPWMMETLGLV